MTTGPDDDEDARASIDAIIAGARFTEQEEGDGTSGPCGTFAIALHAVLHAKGMDCRIVALCEGSSDRVHRRMLGVDVPYWTHFAVESHGAFFDIMGKSVPSGMIKDHSAKWSRPVTMREARILMRAEPGSWSMRRFRSYLKRLDRDGIIKDAEELQLRLRNP